MNADLYSALFILLIQVPVLLAIFGLLRLMGWNPLQFLDRQEWLSLGKLVVATGLLLFLLWRFIYSDLPQELFIYGRF